MRRSNLVRNLASAATVLVFAALGAATSQPSEDDGTPNADAPASDALRALESHLDPRQDYGEGPDGQLIAATARAALAPGDAVAVRVVPGTPRKVVVLVRYRSEGGYQNLREIPSAERNRELDRILEAIDLGYEAGADEIAVAIKGSIFYGAIAVRRPSEAVTYHTGSVISTSVLDPLLTAEAGTDAAPPSLELGSTVEGQLAPLPMPHPAYVLTLSEPRLVRVRITSNIDEENAPFIEVCRGTMRAVACTEEHAVAALDEVPDALYDEIERAMAASRARGDRSFDEAAYRLPAGTYTIPVLRPNCDLETCPAREARFTLSVL